MDTTHPAPHSPACAQLTDDERAELSWLRSENTLLRVQRDILLRVGTGYARDADALLRGRVTDTFHQP